MANVSPEAWRLLKNRDATSAMIFFTPAIDQVIRGDAWLICKRIARARTSRAATMDLDELILLAQLTVGVLSHHAAAWESFSGARCSRTRYSPSNPAISKSELVISPVGLENDTTRSCISFGNSRRHTVGVRKLLPDIHTPPAPNFDASQYPTYSGVSGINSRQKVGRLPMILMMVWKSRRHSWRRGLEATTTWDFTVVSALSIGPMSPLPAGIPMHA